MKLDITTLNNEVADKVWLDIAGGNADPLSEQDDMVIFSVRAKTLPVTLLAIDAVEQEITDRIKTIVESEAYDGDDEILHQIKLEFGLI
jgi:hypothetical protein